MNIQTKALSELTAAPYNPRQISDEALAGLQASVERFGLVEPVIWNQRTGHVVGGHQRLKALAALGRVETDVVVVDLPEIEEKALNLTLNNPAVAGDFTSDIHRLLEEIAQEDPALADILRLNDLAELTAGLYQVDPDVLSKDPDDAPELPVTAITEPGDIWQMGAHLLLCGDALDPEAYGRLLGAELASMVFTDPPYNVDYEGEAGTIANDNLGAEFPAFLRQALDAMLPRVAGALYICMSSSELLTLHRAFVEAGGHWSTFVVWAKDHFTLGRSDYHRQYEPILYGWPEGQAHHWCGDRTQSDVWNIAKPVRNALHPTMKPVELVERAVANSSRLGGLVLDPFAGSGTTAVACERTGRRARLIELDPLYCDVIVTRWEQLTGKAAVRIRS